MGWAPSEAIVNLARQIAANKASTLLSHGMGPNFFSNIRTERTPPPDKRPPP